MILECEDSETGRGSWRRIGRKWNKTSQSCRPVAALSLRNRMPVKEHRASDYLKTPGDIAAYLNAATEECDGDPRLLVRALRNVLLDEPVYRRVAHKQRHQRCGDPQH